MKITLALLAALVLAPFARLAAAESVRPNIVFLYADDWGWGDLSCHGHPWLKTSSAVIICGWNENDEGGWLLPTLGADGKPDEARIDALGEILRLK